MPGNRGSTIKIALDHPRRHTGVGLLRWAEVLIGGLMVLIAAVAGWPAFILAIVVVWRWLSGDPVGRLAELLAVITAIALLGLTVGLRPGRGGARDGALHSRARRLPALVTEGWQLAARVGRYTLALTVVAMAGVAIIAWIRHGDLAILIDHPGSAEGVVFEWLIRMLIAVGVLLAVLYALAAIRYLAAIAELPLLGLISLVSLTFDAVGEAEGAKTVRIRDLDGVNQAFRSLAANRNHIIRPKLIVLTVETAVWRQAVSRVAWLVTVPLIDISEPTANLLWEIEELTARFGPRCVFIGEHDRVRRVDNMTAPPGSLVGRLQVVMEGRDVLAYRSGRDGAQRFARALYARLEAVA